MESVVSFATLRSVDFVNFAGQGRAGQGLLFPGQLISPVSSITCWVFFQSMARGIGRGKGDWRSLKESTLQMLSCTAVKLHYNLYNMYNL